VSDKVSKLKRHNPNNGIQTSVPEGEVGEQTPPRKIQILEFKFPNNGGGVPSRISMSARG